MDPNIPKEVEAYYKLCGMTRQEMIELESRGIISFKTQAEKIIECEALIKKIESQS